MIGGTMRLTTASLVAIAFLLPVANAQEAAGKVQQAIEESANGKCSDVLSTLVKYACEQQATQMAATFKALGKLSSVTYRGIESTPMGKAEVYLATHQNGKMMWLVIVAPDGKLSTFWSPGATQ